LDINGEVIIGDKALQHYYNNPKDDFIDLAKEWNKRHDLPFVFARFCFQKHDKYFRNLAKKFSKTKVKIPQYILKKYAKRSELTNTQILHYLDKITYDIGYKEKKALKLFWKLSFK
jgi:chorismate dehydratase